MDHLNDGNDSVCVGDFILVLVYINVIERVISLQHFKFKNSIFIIDGMIHCNTTVTIFPSLYNVHCIYLK